MRKVLILGIGNTLRSDDGLGVYIVRHMEETGIPLPGGVDLLDGGTAGLDLLGLIDGYDKIVIVDALITDDRPGSIYRFAPEHAVVRQGRFSPHEAGIMEVIRMLGIVECNPEIEFVGIVPDTLGGINSTISPAVMDSVPRAVEVILDAATH